MSQFNNSCIRASASNSFEAKALQHDESFSIGWLHRTLSKTTGDEEVRDIKHVKTSCN